MIYTLGDSAATCFIYRTGDGLWAAQWGFEDSTSLDIAFARCWDARALPTLVFEDEAAIGNFLKCASPPGKNRIMPALQKYVRLTRNVDLQPSALTFSELISEIFFNYNDFYPSDADGSVSYESIICAEFEADQSQRDSFLLVNETYDIARLAAFGDRPSNDESLSLFHWLRAMALQSKEHALMNGSEMVRRGAKLVNAEWNGLYRELTIEGLKPDTERLLVYPLDSDSHFPMRFSILDGRPELDWNGTLHTFSGKAWLYELESVPVADRFQGQLREKRQRPRVTPLDVSIARVLS